MVSLRMQAHLYAVCTYTSCVIIKSSAHIGHTHLDLSGVGISPESDGHGELLHEDGQRPQFPGEDKVKQRPELSQVVLHGAPRQDDPVGSGKLGAERRLNREPPTYIHGMFIASFCANEHRQDI